ncbi:competence protein ComK [Bacillus sp. DX1.1]|uniref:competence protein ComK n=1 Tax=unclassified Bacillus (in: firmicutes) TaxID=185979 RepID=UPI00257108C5|nr:MULTISPECIES: competence protein ComK [unclassified Bacillus (in: firmicutes)]MDM5157317.1 competence protein ComK [Bacillus sp. DX1.1]WJE81544.1 competence protein ComK [Bacillus sp. DX3.1]
MYDLFSLDTIYSSTMMLQPYGDPFYRTKIQTTHGILYSLKTPIDLIKELIIAHNSSTYEGRRKAIMKKWDLQQNTPIPIDHRHFICAIPTKSPAAWDCIWVFYKYIKKIKEYGSKQTRLHFCNGETEILPITCYKMKQQWRKAGNLLSQMNMQDAQTPFGH